MGWRGLWCGIESILRFEVPRLSGYLICYLMSQVLCTILP